MTRPSVAMEIIWSDDRERSGCATWMPRMRRGRSLRSDQRDSCPAPSHAATAGSPRCEIAAAPVAAMRVAT
eukprot:CAMPEP_0180181080 /NCGR_PEP_ID=MMETSP0986-20121125/39937_1 /TAXON_ID=697907 /ORGANISM="non described non described, Strain CCMP2293" /LENGTH=70 /DNA_ID=CAMNT_0022134349 /DNA_START=131 /DNA_END=343 /DNA_ORIENTATION=+